MSAPDQVWKTRLIAGYPDLFKPSGYPVCGSGWKDVLQRMCVRITEALSVTGSGTLHIVEIKQKYGGLRIYLEAERVPEAVLELVGEAVELAEARAECTCEECGAEGRLHDHNGYLRVLCDDHAVGDEVDEPPHHRNLRIRFIVDQGGRRLLSCRIYDRARDQLLPTTPPRDIE